MSVIVLKAGYVIDEVGLVPRIKGLYRDNTDKKERWVVRPTNDNGGVKGTFYDSMYGSAGKAYKAAIRFLHSNGVLLCKGTRCYVKERKDKKRPTGTVGVSLQVQRRGDHEYYRVVCTPLAEEPGMVIYAGTEVTQKHYLQAALILAKKHRSQAVGKYFRKRRVKLEDAMPWYIPGIM